ncbi:hypothetical protein ACFWWC_42765 [Streptomyces sp. NPDC058642]|uniref:hypothetical protein n=1 Tax=Streptomyces sp. NPDC058642 TaxID=3346572 RepID=UPI003667328E
MTSLKSEDAGVVRVLGQVGLGGLGRETVSESSDGIPVDRQVFVIAGAVLSAAHAAPRSPP